VNAYEEFLTQLRGELAVNPLNVEPLLLYLRDHPSRWATREIPTQSLGSQTQSLGSQPQSLNAIDTDTDSHPIIGAHEALSHPALVTQRKNMVTIIEELDVRPSAVDGGPISDLLTELTINLKTGNTAGFSRQNVNRDLPPFKVDAYRCAVFGTIRRQVIVPEGSDFLLSYVGQGTGESFKLDVSMVIRREPVELARLIWPHLIRGR